MDSLLGNPMETFLDVHLQNALEEIEDLREEVVGLQDQLEDLYQENVQLKGEAEHAWTALSQRSE